MREHEINHGTNQKRHVGRFRDESGDEYDAYDYGDQVISISTKGERLYECERISGNLHNPSKLRCSMRLDRQDVGRERGRVLTRVENASSPEGRNDDGYFSRTQSVPKILRKIVGVE